MILGIEMERVVITLLAFLNLPIDRVPMGVILRSPLCCQIAEILEFLRRLAMWSTTRNVRIPQLLMTRSIRFSLSGIEEGGGRVIGRCRIGRQKTYCQMCGKDTAGNEKMRRDTTQYRASHLS